LPKFLTGHDLAGTTQQLNQDTERLLLESQSDAMLAQFSIAQVSFEEPKTINRR